MGIQQLSGIDAVLFYAPSIFTQAGLNSRQGSFLASGVSGIVGVLYVSRGYSRVPLIGQCDDTRADMACG